MATADEFRIRPDPQQRRAARVSRVATTHFGQVLFDRRVQLGLSLREIGRRSGIDNSLLSRWERGQQHPEITLVLPRLARALELPTAELCRQASGAFSGGLPPSTPYLYLKYGETLPDTVLADLADHCASVLAAHGINQDEES